MQYHEIFVEPWGQNSTDWMASVNGMMHCPRQGGRTPEHAVQNLRKLFNDAPANGYLWTDAIVTIRPPDMDRLKMWGMPYGLISHNHAEYLYAGMLWKVGWSLSQKCQIIYSWERHQS